MRRLVPFLLSFPLLGVSVWAGEYALLTGGGRLHVDRHQEADGKVCLYLGAGTVEMNAAEISGFEPDGMTAAPPAAQPVAAAASPEASVSPKQVSPEQLADAAARKYGLPPSLVRSVMKAESGFQPEVVSSKGAVGLMQLMPGTAETLGVNPHDPAQNADAGARYLRELLEKYGGALRHALAAYNAGPAMVARYGGVPPFAETLNYIRRVEREWKRAE